MSAERTRQLALALSLSLVALLGGCDQLAAFEAGQRSDAGARDGPDDADGLIRSDAADASDDGIRDGGDIGAPPSDLCPACPLGCRDSSNVCKVYTPSNTIPSQLAAECQDIVVSTSIAISTQNCQVLSCAGKVTMQPNASGDTPRACYLNLGSLDVRASGSLTVTGPNALIILARGPVTIDGKIELRAATFGDASPGGLLGGDSNSSNGGGPGGGAACTCPSASSSCLSACGGGGGGYGGAGGAGGNEATVACASCNLTCQVPCSNGGGAYGRATLTPLVGGSGGAAGQATAKPLGRGGAGGGALQISSQSFIELSGVISAGGQGGRGAPCQLTNARGGGGGGAGGSVLLEAAALLGGGLIAVNGGGGGGGYSGYLLGCSLPGRANDGADGLANNLPASGGTGSAAGPSGTPGGTGGFGGAGSTRAGQPGDDSQPSAGAGGGGGGVGRIRINWYPPHASPTNIRTSGAVTYGSVVPK